MFLMFCYISFSKIEILYIVIWNTSFIFSHVSVCHKFSDMLKKYAAFLKNSFVLCDSIWKIRNRHFSNTTLKIYPVRYVLYSEFKLKIVIQIAKLMVWEQNVKWFCNHKFCFWAYVAPSLLSTSHISGCGSL